MRQLATSGEMLAQHLPEEDETAAPEIDRGQLRNLLLPSLKPGTVQWGRVLQSVAGPDDGPRTLAFRDGTTFEADLVIGADGSHSRVRTAVSSAVPIYSGVDFLEAWFDDMERATETTQTDRPGVLRTGALSQRADQESPSGEALAHAVAARPCVDVAELIIMPTRQG